MADPDWETIEHDWRDGALSIRAIAAQRGTAESTIRRHAKMNRWPGRGAAEAAERIATRHRRDVARLAHLQDDLADKARALVEAATSVRELADAAAAVERLGRITERLIALERQAFALDAPDAAATEAFAEILRQARQRADASAA